MDIPLFLSTILLLCHNFVNGKNIVLFPFAFPSHISEIAQIGEGLRLKGHNIYMVVTPTYAGFKDLENKYKFNILGHHVVEKDWQQMFEDPKASKDILESALRVTPIESFRINCDGQREGCNNLLSDEELRVKLKELQIDLAIIDAFPMTRCAYVLLYSLDIPYVSLTTAYEPWLFRAPAIPSFVPFPIGQTYSEKMTFTERLTNTWHLLDWTFGTEHLDYLSSDMVSIYAPNKPFLSISQLAQRSQLWLLDTDVIIDYPRPTMPNVKEIGGLTTKPAKPLPQDLEDFMKSAADGAVVVSFGSSTPPFSNDILDRLLSAFLMTKYTFIWRCTNFGNREVPARIKVTDWIPQNDLLGHNNTGLFITHTGANSQFEALYHSIPMLFLPVWGDQPYNSQRAADKGFGLKMDLLTFKPEDLARSIEELMTNPKYRKNVQKASRMFRNSQQHPIDRAVFWVEHVLEFGGEHLLSYGQIIPWYQYLMLDVLVVVFTAASLFVSGIFFLIRWVFYKWASTPNVLKQKKS